MKFKNRMKKFFTLTRESAGGFTLVELIVVIAILGILAGVAIPAYSGYIKKANAAADLQLLDAVNTAFAAACLENGTDAALLQPDDAPAVPLKDDLTVDLANVSPYAEAFARYFEGNTTAAFKQATQLYFMYGTGIFSLEPVLTFEYGGGYISFAPEDVAALKNSTFVTADGLGVSGLLNKVNNVANLASGLNSNALNTILGSEGFQNAAATALGIDPSGLDAKLETMAAELVAEGKYTDINAAKQKLMANAAVLYAAQSTSSMTATDISDLLCNSESNASDIIVGNLSGDPGKALAQAAAAYGLYTSYAYKTGDAELIANTENIDAVLAGLDDPAFKEYVNSNQGKTDAEGYLAALNMVNSSTDDPEAVTSVVANGFNDPALLEILGSLVG